MFRYVKEDAFLKGRLPATFIHRNIWFSSPYNYPKGGSDK